jgi:predicted SAM-dependent methyltransferase
MYETENQSTSLMKDNPNYRKLNLACGEDIRPIKDNWLNVDVFKAPGVEYLDLYTLPWPLNDNEFDLVLASHILEHVPFHLEQYGHTKNFLIMFMEEVWRILKPGGIIEIIVPGGINSFAHAIDHKRIVTAKTFHIFYPQDVWSYYTDRRFELISERKHQTLRFKLLQYFLKQFFMVEIDMLSPSARIIVLKKLPSSPTNI